MAYPASEMASHQWLQQRSGLGELIGYEYEAMGLERLYQASDMLWRHREALQAHLYSMENQQRVTATFRCKNGKTVHLRKSTRAEPEQKQIYDALGVTSQPGCSHKIWV